MDQMKKTIDSLEKKCNFLQSTIAGMSSNVSTISSIQLASKSPTPVTPSTLSLSIKELPQDKLPPTSTSTSSSISISRPANMWNVYDYSPLPHDLIRPFISSRNARTPSAAPMFRIQGSYEMTDNILQESVQWERYFPLCIYFVDDISLQEPLSSWDTIYHPPKSASKVLFNDLFADMVEYDVVELTEMLRNGKSLLHFIRRLPGQHSAEDQVALCPGSSVSFLCAQVRKRNGELKKIYCTRHFVITSESSPGGTSTKQSGFCYDYFSESGHPIPLNFRREIATRLVPASIEVQYQ